MARLNIISPDGEIVGHAEDGSFEATAALLQKLLKQYNKQGVPRIIGDSDEKEQWDGYERIKADDSRFFQTVLEELGWEGYDFQPVKEENGD